MISWRVIGTGGWAERLLAGPQLKKNVIDLSDHEGGLYGALTYLDR